MSYDSTLQEYNNLRNEHEVFIERMNQLERNQDKMRGGVEPDRAGLREKEKRYEEEIRVLKRKVDEAQFEAEKNKK